MPSRVRALELCTTQDELLRTYIRQNIVQEGVAHNVEIQLATLERFRAIEKRDGALPSISFLNEMFNGGVQTEHSGVTEKRHH